MAMSIRRWIKTGEWVKISVAIATAVVAVFSVLIERKLVSQEKERAAVSRSIALYRDFVESDAVKYLSKVDHRIEHGLWVKYGSDMTAEETKKGSISIYNEEPLNKERNKILQSVAELLQNIKIIYDCGNYKKEYEPDKDKTKEDEYLCDNKTISILLGGIMTEIFFAIRPVLYCDDFITNSYHGKDREPSTYIGRFESLILDHMKNEHGENQVFRTKIDWVNAGSVPESFIVRLPEEDRCKHYNSS